MNLIYPPSLLACNYFHDVAIVVVVHNDDDDDDEFKFRKKIEFKMKKSDWFECHGNLVLAQR